MGIFQHLLVIYSGRSFTDDTIFVGGASLKVNCSLGGANLPKKKKNYISLTEIVFTAQYKCLFFIYIYIYIYTHIMVRRTVEKHRNTSTDL